MTDKSHNNVLFVFKFQNCHPLTYQQNIVWQHLQWAIWTKQFWLHFYGLCLVFDIKCSIQHQQWIDIPIDK